MITTLLQKLTRFDKIVNSDGTPTDFLMRLLLGKDSVTSATASGVNTLNAFEVTTEAPILGGPVTLGTATTLDLSHDVSGVTAGTYGDDSNVAQVTVDAKGHVTAAANVAIAFPPAAPNILPVVDGSIPPTFIQMSDGSLVTYEVD